MRQYKKQCKKKDLKEKMELQLPQAVVQLEQKNYNFSLQANPRTLEKYTLHIFQFFCFFLPDGLSIIYSLFLNQYVPSGQEHLKISLPEMIAPCSEDLRESDLKAVVGFVLNECPCSNL